MVAGFLFVLSVGAVRAVIPFPGGGGAYTNVSLNSWSFRDNTNWTSDRGTAPISFTNLNWSYLGDGSALVVETNVPAWLNFNVVDTNGNTNLTVDTGSVLFWFAPGSWSSTNGGPSEWSQLIDVGEWTTNASYGYWGLSVDAPGSNLWFVAQDGVGDTYTLSTPISWTTNYFHYVALTYSSTNVSIYLDGQLATNDPGGLSVWPSSEVLSNGFYFGSDTNGLMQAQGLFNSVNTYNYQVDSNDIQQFYDTERTYYMLSPWNTAMMNLISAPSSPSSTSFTNAVIPDVITGPGNLQSVGSAATCVDGTNDYAVWLTNVTATVVGSGTNATMNLEFTIEGGAVGVPFDVFANSILSFGSNGVPWAWEGQGYQCQIYELTNLPITACFLILGTPQDSDGDGLTDAYELLVSKSNPDAYSTDGTGMADGWEVLYFGRTGISPTGDPDGDGLTTYQEWEMRSQGYNPANWNSFTNSVVGDGYQNYSGDGLANDLQASFGGNLLTNNPTWKVNTAGDAFPDEYKVMVGLSTNTIAPTPGLPSYSPNPIP